MLSGASLLTDDKTESTSVFYKKRVSRLLFPILFWSIFFLAWSYSQGILQGVAPSPLSLGKNLLWGRPYYHMWFLYMIVGLYFITPLTRSLLKNTTRREIIFFVTALFAFAAINSACDILYYKKNTLFINWFLLYLPYFILGYLIRQSEWEPRKTIVILVFTLSVFFTAAGCFLLGKSHGLENGLYFYNYLSITVIPMSISIMFLLKKVTAPIINMKITKQFAGLVLGIYLVHPVVIDVLRHYNIEAIKFNPLISIPMISCIVFLTSAMIAWIIHITPYFKRII
jgi:surface polysaccharide O-acyltransferase-like enzyme